MLANKSSLLVAGLLLVVATAACVSPSQEDDPETGTVSFHVKDAPADEFESVFVTFSRVEVHRSGSGTSGSDASVPDGGATEPIAETSLDDGGSTEPAEAEGAGAGWFDVVTTTQTVDLKLFQGDAAAFLGEAEVEGGHYTQIRIHVDEAYGLRAGERVDFTVPSGTLKIVRPWTVEAGAETRLVVDFELDKSIVATGSDRFMFKATMKLAVDHPDDANEPDPSDESSLADESGRARGGKPDGKGKP